MQPCGLISVQVGLPVVHDPEGRKPWTSGIHKRTIEGPCFLAFDHLAGDGQADPAHHGGPERAILCYAADHYPAWRAELGREDLRFGAFGENFTISECDEGRVCLGDIFSVGEAIVQIAEPRQPCWKLARYLEEPTIVKRVHGSGRTGWYLRVIGEGWVEAGNQIQLEERLFPRWPMNRVNRVVGNKTEYPVERGELAAVPALSDYWRSRLLEFPDQSPRLLP